MVTASLELDVIQDMSKKNVKTKNVKNGTVKKGTPKIVGGTIDSKNVSSAIVPTSTKTNMSQNN